MKLLDKKGRSGDQKSSNGGYSINLFSATVAKHMFIWKPLYVHTCTMSMFASLVLCIYIQKQDWKSTFSTFVNGNAKRHVLAPNLST